MGNGKIASAIFGLFCLTRQNIHCFQVFKAQTGVRVQIFNEIRRSKSWSHLFWNRSWRWSQKK